VRCGCTIWSDPKTVPTDTNVVPAPPMGNSRASFSSCLIFRGFSFFRKLMKHFHWAWLLGTGSGGPFADV
jgi:hypothetical protein